MAQNVVIELEDDLDGGPADETLSFALDERDYEIDLSAANAQMLRRPCAPARRPAARPPRAPVGAAGPTASSSETAKIRAWAKEHGHQVSDRGRIHQHIRDAYYVATSQS
ncbi:Lsr2 family protein [Kocuria dechangensis]|uniref:Lsr2 family protein n=1 Tax=Kocuria dechangensis TaxID=1176249 RepID=A0A917H6U2_9MICC|nr:Lsr2 family protein [Kocuria dechangensis]GGG69666.1 Lsr2 family protein [Kocuria dechangensis]